MLRPMSRRRTGEGTALNQRVQRAFGQRLKEARKRDIRRRVNQDELAEALEISRTSVSNIERGRHRVFLDQVYVAARTLGVEVRDLLPSVDEVFSEPVLSASRSLGPRAARDIGALVGKLRERAIREVSQHSLLASAGRKVKENR